MDKHTYTIEQLYHIQCGLCRRWWSIGDADKIFDIEGEIMACPFCTVFSRIIKQEGEI